METAVDDATAIAAVLSGDTAQYRIVVERYHRGLIRYLYNMTGDATQAEDIAQDAFVQAFRKLSNFDNRYSFSTWVYAIASNIAKKNLATNARRFQIIDGMSSVQSAEESVVQKNRAHDVRAAIATLKPDYQQVINLFYWENKTYDEIAAIVDCPVGTVRTWLSRSKQLLEERLYGHI